MPHADQADQERTKSSAQLHFVIGMGVSGQFLMAVDAQIPIPETANTRRRSLRPSLCRNSARAMWTWGQRSRRVPSESKIARAELGR
jgi:hypothetical protein